MSRTTAITTASRLFHSPNYSGQARVKDVRQRLAVPVRPLELLRSHVSNGGAFIAAQMTSAHRSSSVFKGFDLAVADIDHGLTIDEFKSHPWPPCAGLHDHKPRQIW